MSFQKQEKIQGVVMEDGCFPVRRWEELHIDMLVNIFQSFDLFELICNSSSYRLVSSAVNFN